MDLDGAAMRAIGELTIALDRECRLIDELHRAVLQQREAVSRGDQPGVESSLRLAGRALLTLQETRRNRATLLHRLVGDPAQPLADLDAPVRGQSAARRFSPHASGCCRAATDVAEEVWRNQQMLLGALRERDALLQELLTGSRPTSAEDPPAARAEG